MALLDFTSNVRIDEPARRRVPPFVLQAGLVLCIAAAGAAALYASAPGSEAAVSAAGADLTHLLRMMALLKAGMAAALGAVVLWRLGMPIAASRFAAYAATCAAMAAGTAFIWSMAQVGAGALLLHAGLFSCGLLLWFDDAVRARISAAVAARR